MLRLAALYSLLLLLTIHGSSAAAPIPCDDLVANECTTAPTCRADGSCQGDPTREGLSCTSSTDSCLTNPVCKNGVCTGTTAAPDGTECRPPGVGNCFGPGQCMTFGTFTFCVPGDPVTCPDPVDPCKVGFCNPQTGACQETDKCFTFFGCETCNAGTCTPVNIGQPCPDQQGDFNPCTTDDRCVLESLGASSSALEAMGEPLLLTEARLGAAVAVPEMRGICRGMPGTAPGATATSTPTTVPASRTPTPAASATITRTVTASSTSTRAATASPTSTVTIAATQTPSATTPRTATPTSTVPGSATPTSTTLQTATPTSTVPGSATPTSTTSRSPTPTWTVPGSATPTSTTPHSPTPTSTVPGSATPTSTTPHSPTPTSTVPGSPTPTSTIPNSPTWTSTVAGSPTPTSPPPATATPSVPAVVCAGDCDVSGEVTIDEVLRMVNLALGNPGNACAAGDTNHDGDITVDEIVKAINSALSGCPA